MRIFLDTEFTNLAPGAKLISIALVDEDENYFYAELTDTYTVDDCSDFVKANVLPYLNGHQIMTEQECALQITNWIEDRAVLCVLANDAPEWDMPFLINLINKCELWPANFEVDTIFSVRVTEEQKNIIAKKHGYNLHNSLHDALIMKKATLGY